MYRLEAATNPLLLTAGSDEYDFLTFRHEPIPLWGTGLVAGYHTFSGARGLHAKTPRPVSDPV